MARVIAAGIGLVLACTAAASAPMAACPGASHLFETFALPAPSLGRPKRVLVYLPPGYGCKAHRRYPVFYFNDGQDLFDWNPFAAELDPALAAEIAVREGWYGSWRLDAQLDRAVADGSLPPLIVIGIASDDGLRSRDLVPVPWDGSAEGRGTEYGEFRRPDRGTDGGSSLSQHRRATLPGYRRRVAGRRQRFADRPQPSRQLRPRAGLLTGSQRPGDRQLPGRYPVGRRSAGTVRLPHRLRR